MSASFSAMSNSSMSFEFVMPSKVDTTPFLELKPFVTNVSPKNSAMTASTSVPTSQPRMMSSIWLSQALLVFTEEIPFKNKGCSDSMTVSSSLPEYEERSVSIIFVWGTARVQEVELLFVKVLMAAVSSSETTVS